MSINYNNLKMARIHLFLAHGWEEGNAPDSIKLPPIPDGWRLAELHEAISAGTPYGFVTAKSQSATWNVNGWDGYKSDVILVTSKHIDRFFIVRVPEPVTERVPPTMDDLVARAKAGKTMYYEYDKTEGHVVCHASNLSYRNLGRDLLNMNARWLDGEPCWKEVEK